MIALVSVNSTNARTINPSNSPCLSEANPGSTTKNVVNGFNTIFASYLPML